MRPARSFVALVVVTLSLAACGPQQEAPSVDFKVPVRVREVVNGDVEDRIVATGSLRSPQTVTLAAQTAGILTIAKSPRSGRRYSEGDEVRAGDVIATISGEEVRLAARSEATRRRFLTAKRDYDSKKQLFEAGLISEQELVLAEASLEEARVEMERSVFTEEQTELVSPIDGVVFRLARDERSRPLADGQRILQGFVVAEIAPMDALVAELDLVGPDASRVRVGQEVRVRHHAWSDEVFAGRVLRVAPSLDPVTRAFRVEVEIDNTDLALRPGMFVEATIVVERRPEVPVVPREAVTERSGGRVVFVLRGQRVEERRVTTGHGDDDIVEIRSGVNPGEKVVVKGLETLTNESQVRVTGS